jgi:hypothetical protein
MKQICKFFKAMLHVKHFIISLLKTESLVYGFDPISLGMMGGTALLQGLTSLFSGGGEEEQQEKLRELLAKQRDDVENQYKTGVTDLTRSTNMAKKQRRGIASSINSSKGIYDPTAIFSNEEDIVNALDMGIANLGQQKSNALSNIANKELEVDMMPEGESGLSRFAGGFLGGAGTGLKFADAMGFLRQVNPQGGGNNPATITTEKPISVDNTTNNPAFQISSPINLGESFKTGNEGTDWFNEHRPSKLGVDFASENKVEDYGIDNMLKDDFRKIKKPFNPYRLKPEGDYYNTAWRLR